MGAFGILLKKNFTVWRRDLCCCVCQFITPLVFGLLIIAIAALGRKDAIEVDQTFYLSKNPALSMLESFPQTDVEVIQHFAALAGASLAAERKGEGPSFSLMKDCLSEDEELREKGGYVAIFSNDDSMYNSLDAFFKAIKFPTRKLKSASELDDIIKEDKYGRETLPNSNIPNTICLGITFDEDSGKKWRYNLHFNSTGNPETIDIPDPKEKETREVPFFDEEIDNPKYHEFYFKNGVILIQQLIDNLIIKRSGSDAAIGSNFVKMPVGKYENSKLYSVLGRSGEVFFIFPMMVVFLRVVYHMLKEKENKITENMRNMGMGNMTHFGAWYLLYFLVSLAVSLLFTVIIKLGAFKNSNFLLLWLLTLMPMLVFLALAFLICSFFVKTKPGVLAAIIIFFLFYAISIASASISNPTASIKTIFALSPIAGLTYAIKNFTLLESLNNYGFGFNNVTTSIDNFKFSTFLIITFIESELLFWLGIYLEYVWPTEIGVKKHWLFCCGIKRKNKEAKDDLDAQRDQEYARLNFEELTNAQKEELKDDSNTIQIKGLRKKYGNGKVAVHDLNLEMFNNQIFALLGHNGAGKTTTISMISGLLDQTQGSIDICGYDTTTQQDEIKRMMGVCPQLNPIYPNLTCKEHLELYSALKSQGKKKASTQEIDQILRDIDLLDKKDYMAGKLSGGQKRKLCIGIAFIGGSKVILLDEPTSGMDTYARRFLWEMIKKYKKDRIIILCTHYMDEADYLGDRFGIMGEGKLITCGSSLFLKNRFGVGYDLTVVKSSSSVPSEPIQKVVSKFIPHSEATGDISMEVKFRLPTSESHQFESLFKELEDNKEQYGIQTYGVSLTTLEEVFLKVAVGIDHHQGKEGTNHSGDEKGAENVNNVDIDDFELQDIRVKGGLSVFWIHFKALCKKRFIYFKRDYKGVFCEIFLPIIIITLGLSLTLIEFIQDPTTRPFTPGDYFSVEPQVWGNVVEGANKADYEKIFKYVGDSPGMSVKNTVNINSAKDFESKLFEGKEDDTVCGYFIDSLDPTKKQINYTLFANTTFTASSLICANQMNNAIYKYVSGDDDASIKVDYVGLPLTKQLGTFENTADGLIAILMFALAYSFIPAGVILFIVKEREHNSKHQQIVSGVSVYAYWLSNLTIDVLKYWIPGIYCALSILIFNLKAFKERDHYSMSWMFCIFYGPAIMSFTYLTTFMFKSPETAQIATFVFNFLVGFLAPILSFILRILSYTQKWTIYFPELVFRLCPTFSFTWGFFEVSNTQLWEILYERVKSRPDAWSYWGGLLDFIYLLLTPFLFMFLIFFIESRHNKSSGSLVSSDGKSLLNLEAGDEDVKKEREEVMKSDDYAIKMVDFVKEYVMLQEGSCCSKQMLGKKVAVKGVTFGVKKGDCFGLLGTNGAGKTTTFKALSGEIAPTYGQAQIAGLDLAKHMSKVRHLIGYCPQFETLLDNLTAREHLELYAAIKGIPVNMREKLIQEKLTQLNLKPFENVMAGTYSGGNKRKLSVAIALLGNPPIIFLDEPSSGMDPEARRFMWSVVGKISTEKKHSSVVLTTHSMEEAEALSSKLAIMVEGSIECIGSVQSLKDKYGKGFEIEIKLKDATAEEIQELKQKINLQNSQPFTVEDIRQILPMIGHPELVSELSDSGKLSPLALQVVLFDPDSTIQLSCSTRIFRFRYSGS